VQVWFCECIVILEISADARDFPHIDSHST
jgi:hypothetical protein